MKVHQYCKDKNKMDTFDDIQNEDSVGFDFGEQSHDGLFDEEENNSKNFDSKLNSYFDF